MHLACIINEVAAQQPDLGARAMAPAHGVGTAGGSRGAGALRGLAAAGALLVLNSGTWKGTRVCVNTRARGGQRRLFIALLRAGAA